MNGKVAQMIFAYIFASEKVLFFHLDGLIIIKNEVKHLIVPLFAGV